MKTNKQIKQAIAGVTGGEWLPDRLDKPQLHHPIGVLFGGDLTGQVPRYHSTASIKASEVNK